MARKPLIKPIVSEDGCVYFGDYNSFNIKHLYNINPAEYLKLSDQLVTKGLKIRLSDAKIQVDFVLYCNELSKMGFDLSPLISEFNNAQKSDFAEVHHAMSLVKICYHYKKHKFDVSINTTKSNQANPDLTINKIPCELKTRNDQTRQRMEQHQQLLFDGREDEYQDQYSKNIRSMKEDLETAIKSRLNEGLRQSDCIIFDLSNHFHTWNYYRLRSGMKNGGINGIFETPLTPISNHIIIFSPDNAQNFKENSFNPKALWGYIPI